MYGKKTTPVIYLLICDVCLYKFMFRALDRQAIFLSIYIYIYTGHWHEG